MAITFDKYAEKNSDKALEFLYKAFARKNSVAAYKLGEFYRDGKYLNISETKALEMFNKAALWSLNTSSPTGILTKATNAIQRLSTNKEEISRVENNNIFCEDEIKNHISSFYLIPLVGKTKDITQSLISIFSDIFRGDISYSLVKTQLESKDYSVLGENIRTLVKALDSMYRLYPKICSKIKINPSVLHGLDILNIYPYISFETIHKIAHDIITMFLTLRNTQYPEILPFSFSLSDENFLDACEACSDEDIQIFMISIVEIKIEADWYSEEICNLYRACINKNYDIISKKLEQIKQHIPSNQTNLNFEPNNITNIIPDNMFDDTEKTTEDEFDKLLQEFIEAELKGDDIIIEEETNSNTTSTPLKVNKINLAYDFNTENGVAITSCTHFRKDDGENLHIDVILDNLNYNKECWGFEATFELVSCNGVVWGRRQVTPFIESDEKTHTLSVSFCNLKLSEDTYTLNIYSNNQFETSITINIIDIPYPYTKCFDLEGFGIYRVDKDSDFDLTPESNTQSCFSIDGLKGLYVIAYAENILSKKYKYQLIIRIYNDLGVEIITKSAEDWVEDDTTDSKTLNISDQIRCDDWEKGTYKIEIEFLGEVIVSAEFVLGDRDIVSSYHKKSVQPQTNIAGRGIIKSVDDPLAKLNAMVGLEDIKKDVQLLLSKIAIDKKRAMNNLKTKPISLHAAFLGNAGTGKTTVAKLLGQIYKDIGLLSKGHVIVEERSTLSGQNWNSESDLTNKALEKAKGGILFIDEAYDLVTDHPHDPGRLVISTLLSTLADENNRDWMLILAGYPSPMEKMLNVNEGFRSRLQTFHFKDFTWQELLKIADNWIEQNDYIMAPDARKAFEALIITAVSRKDKHFGNARYVCDLLEKKIIPAMSTRLMTKGTFDSIEVLKTIEYADIPNANKEEESSKSISKLGEMVGLGELKGKINSHLDFVRFVNMRRDNGIATNIPPLHMIFTGNPGTGKTTVADYLGEIYKSMGLLSVGRVIKVSRADMVGHYGNVEQTMQTLLSTAKGNILFIDEAYTLFNNGNPNDPGKRAVEMLLDTLGQESIDMIVIMAGYPKEMEELLTSNPGLTGRFPYKFDFEDYSIDDLIQIAEGVCEKNNLILSNEAKDAIAAVIKKEYKIKDSNFSNARFVVRLITTQILPNMGSRITKMANNNIDQTLLKTILLEDVPIPSSDVKQINNNLFDEQIIKKALDKLDSLVGLTKVKSALHEFVDLSREMSIQNKKLIGGYPLKWSFAGNTGTGKSTVAEILSEILKGMYLLGKGHLVELKAEEIYAGNTSQTDELIKKKMKESQQGLLFVDGDAPQFRSTESRYNPDYLRMCLATNTAEMPGTYAIVIAEHESPRQQLVQNLAQRGVTDFDHTLIFEDYTQEELIMILNQHLSKNELTLSSEAEAIMKRYIAGLCENRRKDYANARTMKLLARSIQKLVMLNKNTSGKITAQDIAEFASSQPVLSGRVGY